MRIAINGMGRIGRAVMRIAEGAPGVDVVHVNDLFTPEAVAHALRRDSVYGAWSVPVAVVGGGLQVGERLVGMSAERDPAKLPWKDVGVDVVLECTGAFRRREQAALHLQAGARKVLISAPGKGTADATLVWGVNHTTYDPAVHQIVSNGSCTTNCLAPVVQVLHEVAGIRQGTINTVHAYTADQNLVDGPHRSGDLRRARSAATNVVPTDTGAAKAIGLVLPELQGRLDGIAVRVPVPVGSLLDLVVTTERPTTAEALVAAYRDAAATRLNGVLTVSDEPLVSSDIVGNAHSAIVDASSVRVFGGSMVRVLAWYDNEWAFSHRMLDIARLIGGSP